MADKTRSKLSWLNLKTLKHIICIKGFWETGSIAIKANNLQRRRSNTVKC